jgi:hypothetical protein
MGYWITLSDRERHEALSAVWAMIQATYAKIGLIVNQPRELYEYDTWELFADDGTWAAFVLNKTTPFGLKLGLAGSDGTRAGRTAAKKYVAENYF